MLDSEKLDSELRKELFNWAMGTTSLNSLPDVPLNLNDNDFLDLNKEDDMLINQNININLNLNLNLEL